MKVFVDCGVCSAAGWKQVSIPEQQENYAFCPVCKTEYDLGDKKHVTLIILDSNSSRNNNEG
jgi:hypothetical protein